VCLGDLCLQVIDALSLCISVGDVSKLEYRRNVGAIFCLQVLVMIVGAQIIVAVVHAETALQQIRDIPGRVVKIRRDEHAEQAIGLKVCRVQRIDIRAKLRTQQPRKFDIILDRRDLGHVGFDRSETARFDRCFVEIRLVIVADHLLLGVL
jgi:hypothetical protein